MDYLFKRKLLCKCGLNKSPKRPFFGGSYYNFKTDISNFIKQNLNLQNTPSDLSFFVETGEYLFNNNISTVLNVSEYAIFKIPRKRTIKREIKQNY